MTIQEEESWALGGGNVRGVRRHAPTLTPGTPNAVPGRTDDNDVMADDIPQDLIDSMRERRGTLNEKMGIEILEISSHRVVATMPVEGNQQPYGLLHGGASVVLAETLGSIGSVAHGYPDRIAVGVDINATHHRSATSGVVTGVATAIHLGRTTTAYDVVITDERGKRVCTSRITCALLPTDRATPESRPVS